MAIDLSNQILTQKDVRETITNTEETPVRYNLNFAKFESRLSISTGYGMFISEDGINLYYASQAGSGSIRYLIMSTAWDITTASATYTLDVSGKDTNPEGVWLKYDGTKMYFAGNQNNTIYMYTLSTAWDLSSATFSNSFSVAASTEDPKSIYIRRDGELLLISGGSYNKIFTYFLSTPWNITTAEILDELTYTAPKEAFFSANGNYVFIATTTTTFRYACSTHFRISSATLDQTSVNSPPTTTNGGIFFKASGTIMYLINESHINQYNLKRGWR